MSDSHNFEPPKYTPQQEYAPVDIFDIPARQRALAQPTELRPYNGFTLLGLWLGVIGFFVTGLAALALWFAHSPIFGVIYVIGLLGGAIFGIPAALACLIGLYQLSFTGFEKGKVVSWLGLVLGLVQVAFAVVSGWVVTAGVIQIIESVRDLAERFQSLYS